MTTPAGLASFKRSMITRYGGTCVWCGTATTAGTDFAFLNTAGKWSASCAACSVNGSVIVSHLANSIGALQGFLTPEQEAAIQIYSDIDAAIAGTVTAPIMASTIHELIGVLAIVTTFTKSAVAAATAPVAATPTVELLTGRIYTVNGMHYRIKESKAGNQYALRFVNNGEGRKGSWDYDRGAINTVRRSGTLMTAEDAAALGHSTHHCVFCSLELTDERSTIVGYGPICAGKHGLPWG